ncbi:A/G-specific adenine glycosylase [Rhodoblastus acidophilus]|uniref:A/G-specific adenine glycosylase n=1 Tax=Rhodoblastus acidophilus TaxID=1074 RepID=UPI0022251A07|nr:A/G-specific adenine glycosylase [Rhodoblastus acidophilus]MCW2284476.1 A/G-specific adenine glycosylase [Rhodoblastus acidophilus]MCW2333323.1 A/G-specific adenine glycosylase [Rhodoblastus acidophilus]
MTRKSKSEIGPALLAWYDKARRDLPWRALPGETPDPYSVWLSEIMLQQTTVAAVRAYFEKFRALWPRVGDLAAAPLEEVLKAWAGLGYYSRARNLHACAQKIVAEHGGAFPAHEDDLRRLPGVGPYTAGAIAAIAFDRPTPAVDGNVERVVARLLALETPPSAAKKQISDFVAAVLPKNRPGDFAQAMMDLGATVCTPRSPGCLICPLAHFCRAAEAGNPLDFPKKPPKKARPFKRGAVFVLRRADGAVLARRRPARGLLGGMTEFFGTDWREGRDGDWAAQQTEASPCARANWRFAGEIDHVFTHFALRLGVFVAAAPADFVAPETGFWIAAQDLSAAALPSVMRKVETCAFKAMDLHVAGKPA